MKKKPFLTLFCLVTFLSLNAQKQLLTGVQNPFSLSNIGESRSTAALADLDNDGDLDILSGSTSLGFFYYENTGTNTAPSYGAAQNNPFGLIKPTSGAHYTPAFVDIDDDGDLDLFSSNNFGQLYYYENTGTVSSPSFAAQVSAPFSWVEPSSSIDITFGDLDNDGDFDMFMGVSNLAVYFYYFENIGTKSAPQFGAVQNDPFGLSALTDDFGFWTQPVLVDFDNDGDLDLFTGDSDLFFIENTGTQENPTFGNVVKNPLNFDKTGWSAPNFSIVDLDNDGDLDLLTGNNSGDFYYYEQGFPKTSIPDSVFEQYLIDQGLDDVIDGSVVTSDISDITSIDVSNLAITDFTGIEDFTALTSLNATSTQISSIDVRTNLALTSLILDKTSISTINVSTNTNLEILSLSETNLTSLNVNANVNLKALGAFNTSLSTINVSSNTLLEQLYLSNTSISNITVTNNTQLKELFVDATNISALDISNLTALENLRVYNTNVSSLNVGNNTQLKTLLADNTNISSIDLAANTNLEILFIGNTQITNLDVSNNTKLTNINAESTSVASLDLSNNADLKYLTLSNTNVSGLDISANTLLEELYAFNIPTTTINLANNTLLKKIFLSGSSITDLDISNNSTLTDVTSAGGLLATLTTGNHPNLKTLTIGNNSITNLDVTNMPNLETLDVSSNQIVNIDINQNNKLTTLKLNDNKIIRAFLSNGANNLITDFDIRNNPDALCIVVDDVNFANTNWTNKDATSNYSLDCNDLWTVYTEDNNFEDSIQASPGVDLNNDGEVTYQEAQAFTGVLDLSGKNIIDVTGLEAFSSADEINLNNNNITDLSSFLNSRTFLVQDKSTGKRKVIVRPKIKIRALKASNNALSSLDISDTSGMEELNVSGNQLTSLNLQSPQAKTSAKNPTLVIMDATNNPNLKCIQVDDVAQANAQLTWQKDNIAVYSVDCQKTLGLGANYLKNNIVLYPNPIQDNLTIQLLDNLSLKQVDIFTIIGKRILSSTSKKIDISAFSKGIYLIKIDTDKGILTSKIVKE